MLKWDNTIIIFLTKDELEKEVDFSNFFKEGMEYAIEIRSLEDGSSFCIHQKLYGFKEEEVAADEGYTIVGGKNGEI